MTKPKNRHTIFTVKPIHLEWVWMPRVSIILLEMRFHGARYDSKEGGVKEGHVARGSHTFTFCLVSTEWTTSVKWLKA